MLIYKSPIFILPFRRQMVMEERQKAGCFLWYCARVQTTVSRRTSVWYTNYCSVRNNWGELVRRCGRADVAAVPVVWLYRSDAISDSLVDFAGYRADHRTAGGSLLLIKQVLSFGGSVYHEWSERSGGILLIKDEDQIGDIRMCLLQPTRIRSRGWCTKEARGGCYA